jgi:hypothetical protein
VGKPPHERMKQEGISDPPRRNVSHTQERPKRDTLALSEGFGEYVCNLLCCGTVTQIDDLLLDQLPRKIHVDLNVFGPLMMNRVL